MTNISRCAVIHCSPQQIYSLVSDIESYPQFFQWCTGSSVETIDAQTVRAHLDVQKSGLDLSFTTLNRNIEAESIRLELVDGPFSMLQGLWTFESVGEGCRISLDLSFEMTSMMGTKTISNLVGGKVFEKIASSLMDDFIRCARERYPLKSS